MESIREYHEATKHSWEKLYQDHHVIDWANQPNPFRTYIDCPKIDLKDGFDKMNSPLSSVLPLNPVKPRNKPVTLNTISTLLYYSMAISAWKSYPGVEPWSLRVNPSSGDLHPTETHLYAHNLKDLDNGAYHYFVKSHQLEQRAAGDIVPSLWEILGGVSTPPPVIIGLNSIFWREAWKYQSRALRYCYLDLGHAIASIRVAALALGFFVLFIGKFRDEYIHRYLCFNKTDEHALLFLAIDTKEPTIGVEFNDAQKSPIYASTRVNKLSGKEVDYPLIYNGHTLTCETIVPSLHIRNIRNPSISPCIARGFGDEHFVEGENSGFSDKGFRASDKRFFKIDETSTSEYSLSWTIRHRRSAIDFDGKTTLPSNVFHFLMQFLYIPYKADFLIHEGQPLIIPYLYVHRVEGLERGLYCFDRINRKLFLLARGNVRYAAKELSLNQDIAGDSAFAISFVSRFDYALQIFGNRGYRYIHYEAGFLGQYLYLGATATGYDATGIGAFIDDDVHTFLKTPSELQVVYHFTVGKRVDDPRISTLPAYNHIHDSEEDIK